uniref:Post-SET domain-containing protein n=1 Tax=Timema bartmani TaxID=61472 RepID=A0A7R9F5X9_9NEOP|nr:unnamed protein product [Timema bartmani]
MVFHKFSFGLGLDYIVAREAAQFPGHQTMTCTELVAGGTALFVDVILPGGASWTVNGELRIGFFCKRSIVSGEEVTFDYQLQRYGKEAQRCHCETALCRGWIGEDPDKEREKHERKERKDRESKRKKEERRKDVKEFLDDMDLEEEIEKLCVSGLKNRNHTLTLSRLMVRAEDSQSREQLLKLLQGGEPACRRLFLDYHGLRLIWSWMMNLGCTNQTNSLSLRMEILQTLSKLPIPNKTMLQESKVFGVVEKWSSVEDESGSDVDGSKPRTDPLLPLKAETADENTLQGIESENQLVNSISVDSKQPPDLVKLEWDDVVKSRRKDRAGTLAWLPSRTSFRNTAPLSLWNWVLERGQCSQSPDFESNRAEEECEEVSTGEVKEPPGEDKQQNELVTLAAKLLEEWATLKEVFRIPKKERIEQMKEHEREAGQL